MLYINISGENKDMALPTTFYTLLHILVYVNIRKYDIFHHTKIE